MVWTLSAGPRASGCPHDEEAGVSPGDHGERDSLWVTSKGLLTTMGPVPTSLSAYPYPASSAPLLEPVGNSFWRQWVSQHILNPCGLRGGVGGWRLQLWH